MKTHYRKKVLCQFALQWKNEHNSETYILKHTHTFFLHCCLFKLESKTLMALHTFIWLWACLGHPCVDCAFCDKDITKHLFYVLIFYLFLSVSKFIPWLLLPRHPICILLIGNW